MLARALLPSPRLAQVNARHYGGGFEDDCVELRRHLRGVKALDEVRDVVAEPQEVLLVLPWRRLTRNRDFAEVVVVALRAVAGDDDKVLPGDAVVEDDTPCHLKIIRCRRDVAAGDISVLAARHEGQTCRCQCG